MKLYGIMLMLALATGGLTACTSDDNTAENSIVKEKTYTVRIPASIGGNAQTRAVSFSGETATTTFKETDLVYVYNKTGISMLNGYLQPTNISPDGKKCVLTGTISGGVNNGNELVLLYNLSCLDKTGAYNRMSKFDEVYNITIDTWEIAYPSQY